DDILQIIAATPSSRQTLLFSATYPEGIAAISNQVQRDPVAVQVESVVDKPDIEQLFYALGQQDRAELLYRIIAHYQPESTLVFCNTKQQCEEVTAMLRAKDLHAAALHGDLEQYQRDQVLT